MTAVNAVLVDAAGTLLHPREPVARTYHRFAAGYGEVSQESAIGSAWMEAMRRHRPLRASDPGWHRFWAAVIEDSTGLRQPELVRRLWDHYAHIDAWSIADGARESLRSLSSRGWRLAVVSNWDTRLRTLLEGFEMASIFDAIVVSAEVGIEKPDPRIFAVACERLGVEPAAAVMVGDSSEDDVLGARAAGLRTLHFGDEVRSFEELPRRLLQT
jgi:REG-2-like HAD superfamily hydrolase